MKVLDFLRHRSKSRKRVKSSDGNSKTPFIPDWDICANESILGSLILALDWSKCSITPSDLIIVTTGDRLQEAEEHGSPCFVSSEPPYHRFLFYCFVTLVI